MSVIAMKHFDALAFVQKSKELGASEPLAEYQARQIEQAIDIAVSVSKEELTGVATKLDIKEIEKSLRIEIKEIETSMRIEIKALDLKIKNVEMRIMRMYGAGFLIILGVLAKGFHWL